MLNINKKKQITICSKKTNYIYYISFKVIFKKIYKIKIHFTIKNFIVNLPARRTGQPLVFIYMVID